MIVQLLWPLLFALATQAWSKCPTKCTCYLDQKGRISVLCKEGGMVGPLDLEDVGLDTEVIKITAPDDNTNALTMSPVFQKYKHLEEIHITKSNIPQLGKHFFWGLTKLDVLNLSQNNITQPLDHNFRGLFKLKELYLDDNRIISLPSGTFRYLPELKVLSVQRNRIEELTPRIFLEISKLKVLKLSGNNLRELNPEVFKDVQELRSLECRGCALSRLNNEIYHLLPHLTHLDLGNNEIENIPSEELRELTRLKYFKLDGNRITAVVDSTFTHQPLLRKLYLARNQIEKISSGAFENVNNLTELDVSYNKLEKLGFLEPIEGSIEVLVLSGNRLKTHALKELLRLEELKGLRLAEIGIADISHEMFPQNLVLLDLGGNHLSTLSRDFLPPSLTELDISRNRFRGLDEDLLTLLDNVQTLKLDGNPWSCDLCYIVPLLERTNRSAVVKEITCISPFTVRGKRLELIRKSELTWCTTPSYTPSYTTSDANFFLIGEDGRVGIIAAGTSVCLLLLTVLVIVGAVCYSKRHAAKYYTHEDKLAMEGESIFDSNHSPLFCDGELSFKFPLDAGEKKVSIATIDEIKKEHAVTNGT
ncbi:hypothetical protein NQ318_020313 [Aromia moschata]|uniref:Uncharacterized protein n=1 Tax=Aromia moschata TaxID=1265417 RepID=A0AAV8ZA05_9CUCU|nr:hypothetical protein NQ318_020313 [Aromia moschata]